MHPPRSHNLVPAKVIKTMGHSEGNSQETISLSELAEKEPCSRHHKTPETGPEVNEDFNAWLHVVAGFVTYVKVS